MRAGVGMAIGSVVFNVVIPNEVRNPGFASGKSPVDGPCYSRPDLVIPSEVRDLGLADPGHGASLRQKPGSLASLGMRTL